jgi:hypothetical protein
MPIGIDSGWIAPAPGISPGETLKEIISRPIEVVLIGGIDVIEMAGESEAIELLRGERQSFLRRRECGALERIKLG